MNKTSISKEFIYLFQFVLPNEVRTIESFDLPKTSREVKLEIEVKDPFKERLNFVIPWDGMIYAYLRVSAKLKKLFEIHDMSDFSKIHLFLIDYSKQFTLSIEYEKKEISYYVSSNDVANILENCMRIQSQKYK